MSPVCPQFGGQDTLPLALVPPCSGLRLSPVTFTPARVSMLGQVPVTGAGPCSSSLPTRLLGTGPGAPRELFKPSEAG